MIIRNNKGITMAVVIMVMLVMFLIGTTFVSVAAYQNTQASNQDKGMRAHYIARAGAESALETWLEASNAAKPSGAFDPVYLSPANEFVDSFADNQGQFEVSITPDAGNPNKIVISSVGKVGEIEKTVNVTINIIQSVIPAPNPSYADGAGFYDYTSGQINAVKGDDFIWPPSGVPTTGIVKNEAKKGKGLKIPNKNTGTATQVYEKMLFSSTLQVLHNSIILKSDVIVFMDDIDFSNNTDGKGELVLKFYGAGNPVPGLTGNWGIVIFNGVGYYFKDNVAISKTSDIIAHVSAGRMVLITDQDVINDILHEIVGDPLTVTSYSILWSK